jgi:hypothetical protein
MKRFTESLMLLEGATGREEKEEKSDDDDMGYSKLPSSAQWS